MGWSPGTEAVCPDPWMLGRFAPRAQLRWVSRSTRARAVSGQERRADCEAGRRAWSSRRSISCRPWTTPRSWRCSAESGERHGVAVRGARRESWSASSDGRPWGLCPQPPGFSRFCTFPISAENQWRASLPGVLVRVARVEVRSVYVTWPVLGWLVPTRASFLGARRGRSYPGPPTASARPSSQPCRRPPNTSRLGGDVCSQTQRSGSCFGSWTGGSRSFMRLGRSGGLSGPPGATPRRGDCRVR